MNASQTKLEVDFTNNAEENEDSSLLPIANTFLTASTDDDILALLRFHSYRELKLKGVLKTDLAWNLLLEGDEFEEFGIKDLAQCNILHAAVISKNYTVLKNISVSHTKLVNTPNNSNQLPIHLACQSGDYISIAILTTHTININSKDCYGLAPVHYVTKSINSISCFIELFKHPKFNFDILDPNNKSLNVLAEENLVCHLDDLLSAFKKSKTEDEENTYIIPLTITKKVCTYNKEHNLLLDEDLEEIDNDNFLKCDCGQVLDAHEIHNSKISTHQWSLDDVIDIATDCYGEIEFSGVNTSAHFVRISDQTSDSTLDKLLFNMWDLGKPTVILSIYGTDLDNSQFKNVWQKGLWKAGGSSGSWILTDGYSDLAQLSGKAIKDYCDAYGEESIRSIGICAWDAVANRNNLHNYSYKACCPAIYQYDTDIKNNEDEHFLDNNHTNFLLCDSGLYGQQSEDLSINFRIRFEKLLKHLPERDSSVGIDQRSSTLPMCIMLSGGTRKTLKEIHGSLIINESPLVIMKGTGGLADMIVELIIEMAEAEEKKKRKKHSEDAEEVTAAEKLKNMMIEIWGLPLSTELDTDVTKLKDILSKRGMIEIFSIEEDAASELDAKILSTLLNSAKDGDDASNNQTLNLERLRITMTLDRSDVAKEKVFIENKKWRAKELNSFMKEALLGDKVSFVKLFLDQGFNLESYVTVETLEELYYREYLNENKSSGILKNLLEAELKTDKIGQIKIEDIGKIIGRLMGTFYKPLYLSARFQKMFRSEKGKAWHSNVHVHEGCVIPWFLKMSDTCTVCP